MKKLGFAYLTPIFALSGLALGLIFHAMGSVSTDNIIWMITMLLGTLPIIWKIAKDIYRGHFGVDLIAMAAIVTSFVLGQYLAGTIVLLMLSGGEALEDYALKRAKKELSSLISNAPTFAHIKKDNALLDVHVSEIQLEDIILIKPGELIASDGVVISGTSQVDESALTGESLPVEKTVGSTVLSGSVNKGTVIEVRVLKLPSESRYEQIIKLIKNAEENRAPVVRLADRYSIWFTVVTFILALLAWYLSHDSVRLLAVLVVATPCPLILATPIAMISGISKAASRGIIVKSGGALETLAQVEAFIFDKTGTLTLGQPEIVKVVSYNSTESEILRIAASLDQLSLHILARSLKIHAIKNKIPLTIPEDFTEDFGNGVSGSLDGHEYYFGKLSFLDGKKLLINNEINNDHDQFQNNGEIAVYLGNSKEVLGAVIFADVVRPEMKTLFADFRKHGMHNLVMLTGDKQSVADTIARELGLDDIHAEALPEDKVIEVKEHKKEFGKVAMVGDGINDAPALAASDVGIALGGHGSSASSDSGDIVIMVDNLGRVGEAYKIAKTVFKIAKQGIFIGIGVSIILMIIAALGYIPPVYGALIQEALDVVVILNALRVIFVKIA